MKPVNVNCPLCDGVPSTRMSMFAKQIFDMPEPIE